MRIEHDIDALCQQYLYKAYGEKLTICGGEQDVTKSDGEILYPSLNQILKNIILLKEDVFVDLGSGSGKIVSYVFLHSLVKQAIGIEVVPKLHHQAQWIANKMRKELPEFFENGRQLTFLQGDFLQMDLSMATILIINSTCFNQAMMIALGDIINKMTNIHTVLTLRPFANLQRLVFAKMIRVQCSWDSALCYIYNKSME